MYLLNITDQNEITLLEKHFKTWNDLYNYMYNFKTYKLNNIKIDVFKYENIDDLEYIGDFNQVKTRSPEEKKKEEIKTNIKKTEVKLLKIILSITILILTFIISFIKAMTK